MTDETPQWERWFAWHPIIIDDRWVFWTTVERKVINYGMDCFIWYRHVPE